MTVVFSLTSRFNEPPMFAIGTMFLGKICTVMVSVFCVPSLSVIVNEKTKSNGVTVAGLVNVAVAVIASNNVIPVPLVCVQR